MKFKRLFQGWLPAVLVVSSLLVACGGGGIGSGGTGATSQGLAVGTVSGFGSVFVDGVRCIDLRAKISSSTFAGGPEATNPEVKLGQRVEVNFDASTASCTILELRVSPELVGLVTQVSPLVVAGQNVTVVADATDAPATVLEGFGTVGIQVGDRVEVHGQPVGSGASAAIQATRIEHRPASDTWVRVAGVIKNFAGTQFTLGGLTVHVDGTTIVDPAGSTLANDLSVVVWSLQPVANDGSITAKAVRIKRHALTNDQAVRIDGAVAGCPAAPAACTSFSVDGINVDIGTVIFDRGTLADVTNGRYVKVQGSYVGDKLVATRVAVRRLIAGETDVRLIGLVSDFIDAGNFSVRGVPVSAAPGVVAAGCTIAPEAVVAIEGEIVGGKVVATKVDCRGVSDGLTVTVFGRILNLDATTKTFNLSEGPFRTYKLRWDDTTTVFGGGLSAATLADNDRVGVQGTISGNELVLSRIVGDEVPAAPVGKLLFGNMGLAHDVTSTSLGVNAISMEIRAGISTVAAGVENGKLVRAWFYRDTPAGPWVALQVKPVAWN